MHDFAATAIAGLLQITRLSREKKAIAIRLRSRPDDAESRELLRTLLEAAGYAEIEAVDLQSSRG
jgi:hypothetical protein